MPDRLDVDLVEDRIERLNRAIDRLVDGGPAPVLQDPDLQELLSLAGRLYLELPRDLPDPAFRTRLKAQLTDEHPVVGHRRAVLSAVEAPRRFPYVAALAGIAALLIAVAGVGSLALWSQRDSGGTTDGSQLVRTVAVTATSPLTGSTLGFATATMSDVAGVSIETPDAELSIVPEVTTDLISPTPAPTESRDLPSEGLTPGATTAPDSSEPTASTAAPEPTRPVEEGVAAIPPVDGTTVEDGPVPLASGGGSGPDSGVTFVLDTQLPDLGSSSLAYVLEPPRVDPEAFVGEVGAALRIEGDVRVNEATGEPEYSVDAPDGTTFRWYPSSGEFSYAAPAGAMSDALDDQMALERSLEWLAQVGYPVERLKQDAAVQQLGESQWLVETWAEAIPQPGVGHQLGTRIIVEGNGTVTSATGYWLDVTGTMTVPLLTAEEAWNEARTGAGYWHDGGTAAAGGEMRCGSVTLSYLLTDSGAGSLILQPVIKLDGVFLDTLGSETPVSIYVQATRQGGENTP